MSTEFPGDGMRGAVSMLRAERRADHYAKCGSYWSALRCVTCGEIQRRHVMTCHLRGCVRCGKSVRLGLVNRYLPRLRRYRRRMLRHVILPFTWIGVARVNLYDWLLGCVNKMWRRLGWLGCVATVELKEEYGGQFYMHVHAIAVSESFDYGETNRLWYELTMSERTIKTLGTVRFKNVYSEGGLLWYLIGYTMKDWLRDFEDAGAFVSVMRTLSGKRLLRGYGCLYGRRGRKSSPGRAVKGELVKADKSVAEFSNTCRRCGGEQLEWISGKVVNGVMVSDPEPATVE